MSEINVRITLREEMLGTCSNNKEIHAEFIASKAPDAESREEEIAAIGVDQEIEKSMTIFPKDENGNPFIWNYLIKGFFKDSCSALQRCKGEEMAKHSEKLKAYKKVIDGCIFVEPRRIALNFTGNIGNCQRPLRGQTAQGERIALANSETVPAGTTMDIKIVTLSKEYDKMVIEWLNYGKFKGLGQWRNSGKGSFDYEILK